jgi:hypothetical protein
MKDIQRVEVVRAGCPRAAVLGVQELQVRGVLPRQELCAPLTPCCGW